MLALHAYGILNIAVSYSVLLWDYIVDFSLGVYNIVVDFLELVDYIIGDDGLFGELVRNLVFHCSQGLTR